MKWWSDLWLNEGFATYMATLGVDHIEPDWEELKETAADDFLVVTAIDALQSSHPVCIPIKDPRLIAQIFDTITYRKGERKGFIFLHFLPPMPPFDFSPVKLSLTRGVLQLYASPDSK